MFLDLHVHYKRHARDEATFEEDQIRAAIANAVDGIAFTEHHQKLPPGRIAELRAKYPEIAIYSAVELTVRRQGDVLIYGNLDPALMRPRRSLISLLEDLERHGGVVTCLAHPFRKGRMLPGGWERCDFIESSSRNTPAAAGAFIEWLADRQGIPTLVNSDSHKPKHFEARFRKHFLGSMPRTDDGLVELLRQVVEKRSRP